MIKTLSLVCATTLPLLASPMTAQAAGLKVVIFDLEPVEMPATPKVRARLRQESDMLRKLFADKGFTIVDTAPQAAKIADNLPLSRCNGCDQDIARALGADLEVATAVQQSSSAIYNLSGSVKEVATNRTLREGVVDIRGDNDDTWNHGIKFLTKERLLDPPLPIDAAGLKAMVATLPQGNR